MAHQPYRPFESLEWYREAARNNFRDDEGRSALSRWASGTGMLHAHFSLFAASIVAMLAINLLRTPDSIWADKWIMAWTVLFLIHAVAIGIVWAIRQWNSDAPDEALQMTQMAPWQQSPMFAWTEPMTTEAQDVDFRASESENTDPTSAAEAPLGPGWMGWNAESAEEEDPPEGNRASWKEASAAAWLDRTIPAAPADASDPEAKPHA
jgi:hypothetical protein